MALTEMHQVTMPGLNIDPSLWQAKQLAEEVEDGLLLMVRLFHLVVEFSGSNIHSLSAQNGVNQEKNSVIRRP